jgi:hypothetical protein
MNQDPSETTIGLCVVDHHSDVDEARTSIAELARLVVDHKGSRRGGGVRREAGGRGGGGGWFGVEG